MKKSDSVFLVSSYLVWLAGLFLVIFLATKFIPLQTQFLGGGLTNYLSNPFLWVFGNFDGEHYLSLARVWYEPLTYFFFPLYPMIMRAVSSVMGLKSLDFLAVTGILISNMSLISALIGLVKLIKLDFKVTPARFTIILLLIFPTSFYFGSIYTESVFLALSIWTFYFARRGKFLPAGILSALATATRVIGITLPLVLAIEFFLQRKKSINLTNILGLLISPLGILFYMLYLKNVTGNALEFFSDISVFGEQRQSAFILLPQVFYRYFFKIIPNVDFSYFPVIFSTFLEIFTAVLFFFIIIFSFRKLPVSYWLFLTLGYLLPTFSGSFSSLPRYVLILFPAYIFLSTFLQKSRLLLFAFLSFSFILLLVSFALFARGYWIS